MALLKVSALASLFVFLTSLVNSATAVANGNCFDAVIPVNITADNTNYKLTLPKNQEEVTDLFTRFTSLTSNVTTEIDGGTKTIKATYKIWTSLCIPNNQDAAKTVELAVHGAGFDHSWWNFGGDGSKYNYVEAALKAGHAILIYDRLGTGQSDKPDGIAEVQVAAQVEIAGELAKYLRAKPRGNQFDRVIGVGHSFGSAQLVGLARKYGNVLNATVLTGFTTFVGGTGTAAAAFGWTIASVQNPKRFSSLPSSYIISEGISNSQNVFFRFGGYDPAVLQAAENTKATSTIGEILNLFGSLSPVTDYTNPIFIVTGDKDYILCGGNCYQKVDGVNLLESTKGIFPAVTKFSTYIPANTGHGNNLHLSAPEQYSKIQEWIAQL
ncbi:hypothetical protein D9611_008674 [Ephemerocybe angulata]|uniref:AB hydrolase-1 domain-containing protein n=1 Tax=Ephemerocybe angulata TaxID=980116 RepID=A0A8H5EUW8_9AGAR|nr:hypothetical protein D9611_008674 [Tulosesus angulatus]